MVDHQLRRKKLTFEQFVELDNLVADPNRRNIAGHQQLHTSGLLRFRMLQLLEQVLGPAQRNFGELEADPLRKAWLIAHDAQVSYYGPAGVWLVPGTAYWDIYEQNKNAKWAEEVAWIASQHGPSTDACETDCLLGSQLMGGPQQYWQRFPNGPHIAEALRYAADRARLAGTCSEFDTTRDLVEEIRTSLAKVTHPEKLQVLKSLDQLKRPCAT